MDSSLFDKKHKGHQKWDCGNACNSDQPDKKKNLQKLKNLRPGDYFGEISLVYGCKRTATVISTKYSTLAMLEKQRYKEILIEFPDL